MHTALFTGSFDPFTIGHDNIIRRALTCFDDIVVGVVADNVHKQLPPAHLRAAAIEQVYADEPRVRVEVYDGLAIELARRVEASVIVKGIRSVKDFEYEREQAEANRALSCGIETLFLPADPSMAYISSSLVRELRYFGHDVSHLLP